MLLLLVIYLIDRGGELNERFRKRKARGKPRAFPLLGGFFFGDHHGSSTGTDDGGNEGAVCAI